jgi:hypothetical protein
MGGMRRGEGATDAVVAKDIDLGRAVAGRGGAEGEEGLDWVVGDAAINYRRSTVSKTDWTEVGLGRNLVVRKEGRDDDRYR